MGSSNLFQVLLLACVGLVVCCEAAETGAKKEWDYNNQTDWNGKYPLCKGKAMRQSPIDIITSKVVPKNELSVEFLNYDQKLQVKAKNSEHSVSVKPELPPWSVKPIIKLSWLPDGGEFELQEIHFHWGSVDKKGSEHKVDGVRSAAEMHMVHFKKGVPADKIGSVENSVAVVGVFIESSEKTTTRSIGATPDWWNNMRRVNGGIPDQTVDGEHETNKELEHVMDETAMVNGTDTSKEASDTQTENMRNLLPKNMDKFYTYLGSLTTPPCYEVVTWIVLDEPIYISKERLEKLYNMATTSAKGLHRINQNFREVQPLLNRPVYSSFNVKSTPSTDGENN